MKRVASFMLTFLLVSLLITVSQVSPAKASGTIYIRADGSIDPPSAPISREGSIYSFTGNINDSIVVERSNIIIDGAGYTLQGSGSGRGFYVSNKNDVTIVNTCIRGFDECVFFLSVFSSAIIGNNISDCTNAVIYIQSSSNTTVLNNRISESGAWAIALLLSSNNVISENNIESNYGSSIWISTSSNANIITQNNVFSNLEEIGIYNSSDNLIFHNNFVNNTQAGYLSEGFINFWDNGYPSGGNYWSSYSGLDLNRGPFQNDSGRDGIGDTPYIISVQPFVLDRYPLMGTFGPSTPPGENVTVFPADDICVTYQTVTSEGLTTVENPGTGPAPPPGFTVKQYYVIETTADYAGNVSIKIICNLSMDARGDSTLQEGWQLLQCVMLAGDVDEDFDVDIFDIVRLAGGYLAVKPDPRYDPLCDLDHDGDIDIFDIVRAAGNYGKVWDPATGWSDITTRVDEENNSIFGVTNSLSIFGITKQS